MATIITINLAQRRLTLYQNDNPIKSYPIGIGKKYTPTPPGTFHIINKVPNPGGPFGVLWMGLSQPHYGIHGTNDPSSIGKIVSHGCIRMFNRDVLELSRLVPIGTAVIIRPN